MNALQRLLAFAVSATVLLFACPAFAQSPTDTFSVTWFGKEIPISVGGSIHTSIFDDIETDCDPCQAIADELARAEAEMAALGEDMSLLNSLMESLEADIAQTDELIAEAEKTLEEFMNPKDFVEADGRHYDSADNAAMQRRSANIWIEYQAGALTAEEYSAEIAKPFDDPAVAKELEKIKRQMQDELEQNVNDLKKRKKDQQDKLAEWDALGKEMMTEYDNLEVEIAALTIALEKCEQQCAEPVQPLPENFFGDPNERKGFFDALRDFFKGDKPPLPPILPTPDPVEMLPLDLVGPLPQPVAPDPAFVPGGTQLPPSSCRACDPIRNEIKETEDSLQQLKWQRNIADTTVRFNTVSKVTLEISKRQLEEDLDKLRNPPASAESDGRRMDSADQAAMKVRNARLWDAYKDGDLTAQELSDEWAKPFDDPEVQKELDKIKDKLEQQLEDHVKKIADIIKDVDKTIAKANDTLVELAGKIAAHEKVLEFLRKQLEDCEKQCREPVTEDKVLIDDFDVLINNIGNTLRIATGDLDFSKTDTVEDDMDDIEFEMGDGDEDDMDDIDYEEEEEEEEVDEDEDVGLEIPATEFKSHGFFCGVPVLRAITCNDKAPEDDMDDIDDEDDMDIDAGIADFTQPYVCCDGAQTEDCKPCEEKTNWLCSTFKVFCPKPKFMTYDLSNCFAGQQDNKVCNSFAWDWTDEEKAPEFFLKSSKGLEFPLLINGLDGNPQFGVDDIIGLGECINLGPQNCWGLDFNTPDSDAIFDDGFESGETQSWGLGARDQNGKDVLFGDPVNRDVINVGGGSNDILQGGPTTLPDDLIGPGDDTIIGGPPSLDILGDPPAQSEPNIQNDPQVQQVVQAAVQKYLQANPLGPCEKLQVQVSRIRIGNRVRYTVKIKRIRDDALCPQCPSQTSFQTPFPPTADSCAQVCGNGGGGCTVIQTLPDGMNCVLCGPRDDSDEDDIDLGCQFDEDCADGDECTRDYCDRNTGQCSNPVIPGCGEAVCGDGILDKKEECEQDTHCVSGSICNIENCKCVEEVKPVCPSGVKACETNSDCSEIEFCNAQCCAPIPPKLTNDCPDFAHESESACKRECNGDCRVQKYENASCYFCVPSDEPVKVSCDYPYMEKPQCDRTCDGVCQKTYTTSSKTECFSCIEDPKPVCGNGVIEEDEQCDDGNTKNGDGCDSKCRIEEPKDTGPSCPSGTTSSLSTCQSQCGAQGGTCVDEDQTGCYSCVVVNCPSGSSKECPSSCSSGCDKVGEQYGVSCYQCKQSCEDVCAQNGYGGPNTDHSSAILSELNGYSCVSGANISIQTATIGSCSCIGEYSLSVNQTPPVCTGTPCGDVSCGSSATCQEGDTTITVNCNWGGWEKIQKHQFRPIVGN